MPFPREYPEGSILQRQPGQHARCSERWAYLVPASERLSQRVMREKTSKIQGLNDRTLVERPGFLEDTMIGHIGLLI